MSSFNARIISLCVQGAFLFVSPGLTDVVIGDDLQFVPGQTQTSPRSPGEPASPKGANPGQIAPGQVSETPQTSAPAAAPSQRHRMFRQPRALRFRSLSCRMDWNTTP